MMSLFLDIVMFEAYTARDQQALNYSATDEIHLAKQAKQTCQRSGGLRR
jgi:hypothetical protein